MTKKLKTIDLKGNAYAQVKERIQAFRADTVRGSISTDTDLRDGVVIIKATVISDLSDESSKRATGQSFGKVGGQKEFEKLETIAVGRALAFMGYGTDGAVASADEMEDFEAYKLEKKNEAIETLRECKSQDDLKTVFLNLGSLMADKDIIKTKDELKAILK